MTILTKDQLYDLIIADIEAAQGTSVSTLAKAFWKILAKAYAGALHLVYRMGSWLYDQIFTSTMEDAALIARGAEYGLTKSPAQIWKGTATATGTDGTTISAGTLYNLSGVVYSVSTAVDISGGSVSISLESLEKGDAVNLSNGAELKLVSPQTGLDSIATVTATTQSGEDVETSETFRSRIEYRQQNQPQGGSYADWIIWATEVAGIGEARVERPAAGFVNVYPIADEDDPADRIPDAPTIAIVQAYLEDDSRCPIRAAGVAVVAPTEIEFDVDITGLSPSNATVQAAIETAIEAYLYSRRPSQYLDTADSIAEITAAEITAEVTAAGAKSGTVDLKNSGGSSITTYTLEMSELAKLRTLTWL